MKKKVLLVGLGVALAVGLGVFGWSRISSKRVAKVQEKPVNQVSGNAPALNPLEIEAMRARQYPASDIKVEQDLGEQGGYQNSIVSYTSDGLKLYALMSRPDGAKPVAGWPVVILEHGYIDPGQYQTDGPDYQSFISTLAKAGYLVFKPDYRGHGKSEGQPLGGHFSPVYDYDVLNLVAAVKQYPDANATEIGQLGHSLGGHVALNVAVISSDVKATVIAAGVVGSAEDLFYNWANPTYVHDQPAAQVQGALQDLIKQYGDPRSNPDFWAKVSAVNYVKYIVGPVQIHHGTSDTTVPKLFSDHLDAAMKAAGKPDEYYVYDGGDHQFSAPSVRALFLQRMVDFFDRTLKS